MSELIYIHRGKKAPYSDESGTAEFEFAEFVAGETRDYGLRFLKSATDGSPYQEYPNLKSVTSSISVIDARPAEGTLAYQFGAGISTANNTTAALQASHNGPALQAAINAVGPIVATYGAATVFEVPGGFTIYFANATGAIPIRARRNRLMPYAVVRAWAEEIDEEWVHEIRLVQAALEVTSAWPRKLPPAPTIETIQDGGYDNSGQFPSPEVQRLHMPPEFLGTYQIRRSDNLARTVILDRTDDPESTVRDAIRTIFSGETGITVKLYENYADITFGGDLNGENIAPLEIVPGEAPPGDPTISLNLQRGAVYRALRGQPTVTAFLEVRAYIAADDADPEDPGKPGVLFRREVTIIRDQNYDGAETAQEPAWLRPRDPENYTPTTPDQIQTGISYWSGVKGNGVSTSIPCDHNLASQLVASLTVLDNTTGETRPPTSWAVTSDNTLTLVYDEAPALNSLKVIIAMAVPVSQWDPHTHTQDQIEDLVEDLETLFTGLAAIQAKYESIGVPASSTAGPGVIIQLPLKAEVLFSKVAAAQLVSDKGVDESKLTGVIPYLLPAVHDATVAELPTPLPAAAANAGSVYQNLSGNAVQIAGGGGQRSKFVKDDGYVACDGRILYPASKWDVTNSYYSSAFERPLFPPIAITAEQFLPKSNFELNFGVQLQLLKTESIVQWVLVVELGTFAAQTTPDPVSTNLESVNWLPPVFEQPIKVTGLLTSHFFGLRIRRNDEDFDLEYLKYRGWNGLNDAAPASANFAVRARMVKFDTVNAEPDARGWLFYQLVGTVTTDEQGKQTIKPATVVIS